MQVILAKPTQGRGCVAIGCCAPSIVDVVTTHQPGIFAIESLCRAHFIEWAADVETHEFLGITFVPAAPAATG